MELAFYGGTFTALPGEWMWRFLELANDFAPDVVAAMRCSTRPDAVTPHLLRKLRAAGMGLVELGVQSFAAQALKACNRGYSPFVAQSACGMVKDAGLQLGIQLLPGAPGQRHAAFREDIRRTAALGPALVRLYPCLVLQNAPLAAVWRRGEYVPWGLERAAQSLGRALLDLWNAGVRVGRTGVAQERGLEAQVLAGPWHPALGAMARSAALFRIVRKEVLRFTQQVGREPSGLLLPRRYQGEFHGQKNRLGEAYARLGLGRGAAKVWDKSYFLLF